MVEHVLSRSTAKLHEHTASAVAKGSKPEELEFRKWTQFYGESWAAVTAKWQGGRLFCKRGSNPKGRVAERELVAIHKRSSHFVW
jgi:hypothetical protein